ncbi:MAG: hypothetical protein RRC34_04135 [Lentisphaeria bacterium]|nr:hypothetical protein [Lentisphaeria bacterium]
MMRRLKTLLSGAIFFACLTLSVGALAVPVRVALMPLDDPSAMTADMVLAELSGQGGIVFLERSEINKIRAELKLGEAGFVADEFIPDQKLLENTDVFAVLKESNFIAFDAMTGVRLVDRPTEDSEAVGKAIQDAVHKRDLFNEGKTTKFAFLPLVVANLNKAQAETAKEACQTFIRQVGQHPDTVVLERRHLLMLLDEPEADKRNLTKGLFAGTILGRPSARPGVDGQVEFRIGFHRPGAQDAYVVLETQLTPGADVRRVIARFLAGEDLPSSSSLNIAGTAEEKAVEADEYLTYAAFAAGHLLTDSAMSTGGTAVTLDRTQEIALCEILSRGVFRLARDRVHTRDPHDRAAFVDMFGRAARLARKHLVFPTKLSIVLNSSLQSYPVKRLDTQEMQSLRASVEALLETRRLMLEDVRRQAETGTQPGLSGDEKLLAMQARAKYAASLFNDCSLCWDLSYLEKYAIPEVRKLITQSNDLGPELWHYRELLARNRSNWLGIMAMAVNDLTRMKAPPRSAAERQLFDGLYTELTHSKLMRLAFSGYRGLVVNEAGVPTGKLNIDPKRPKKEDTAIAEAVRRYEPAILSIYESDDYIAVKPYTLYCPFGPSLLSSDARFRIRSAMIRRFGVYTGVWLYADDLGREEAETFYRALIKWLGQIDQDPRIRHPGDDDLRYRETKRLTKDALKAEIKKFSETYGFPPITRPNRTLETPFSRIVTPLKDTSSGSCVTRPASDGRYILFATAAAGKTRLCRLDTENDLAMTSGEETEVPSGWGQPMTGSVLLDDYYAVSGREWLTLYPLDGSSSQFVNFSNYFEGRNNCIAGCGNRLFLSYGNYVGNQVRPGTLLEYNVATKEVHVLISTLDPTVDWPLSGLTMPYHIHRVAIDPERKRLLTFLHSSTKFSDQGYPPARLYAYDWEARSWQAISQEYTMLDNDDWQPFVEDGKYFLLSRNPFGGGFGPLDESGSWQPQLLADRDRLIYQPSYRHLRTLPNLDVSQLIHFDGYPGRGEDKGFDFHSATCQQGFIWLRNMLIIPKEKRIFTFSDLPQCIPLAGSKFAAFYSYHAGRPLGLKIGIVKPLETLKREAVLGIADSKTEESLQAKESL